VLDISQALEKENKRRSKATLRPAFLLLLHLIHAFEDLNYRPITRAHDVEAILSSAYMAKRL
jgi:hypothetical protein